MEKTKQASSSLFAKTKTTIARGKQMALEKMGKAEETVDISFNQERDRFEENYKTIKKLNKDTVKLLELFKDLCIAQAELAEDFYSIYDSKAHLYNAALKYQDITKAIDTSRIQLEEQLRADMIDPISKYLGQFKEMSTRIDLHKTRRIDMDRYSRDVKIHQEKAQTGKLTISEQKYEAAKVNFNTLHDELMKDLPALYEDRIPFFDPVFATYLSGVSEFYRQVAKTNNEVLGLVVHVDRSAVHKHPRAITSVEDSSANFKSTTGFTGVDDDSRPRSGSTDTGTPIKQQVTTTSSGGPPTKAVPTPPAKSPKAKAVYDFNAQEANELPFKIGDIITIVAQKGDWWEGELNGKRGLLPSNYVELIK